LLADTEMPERWRKRLQHHFWRPAAFREFLERFCAGGGAKRSSISDLVDRVNGENALTVVETELAARNLPLVGGRDPAEIAERLTNKALDRMEAPLPSAKAHRLNAYLSIVGEATAVDDELTSIGGNTLFAAARQTYAKRLFEMEELGLNPRRFTFAADFGREIEYYTGFTFQIEAVTSQGAIAVAGGGRYDNLLSDMGSPVPVAAVGSAIHTDRLKAVLG
jgi:ATP phosphoribosyltransferase regulatory subunit